jgi:hypothetical protein
MIPIRAFSGRPPVFFLSSLCALCLCGESSLRADPPVAAYIFPAGGQRGKAVDVRVGGLFLHKSCSFEMLGPGVEPSKQIRSTKTTWFEGPLLPLVDSQQAEDYPKDMAGRIQIAGDAPLGFRFWRLATSQGATPAMKFMVGELPEIVEEEIEGKKPAVDVQLPVTINGRIFPREDVDAWAFQARKGQSITAEVFAARLGSPLDSRIEVLDPRGRRIAENDDTFGADSFLRFTAPVDGKYTVRIHDVNFRGGQAFVYRLTLTSGPWVDRAYPLGGRRESKVKFQLSGQGVPADPVEIALPATGTEYTHRLSLNGQTTNPFLLDLSDLPEYLKMEPNDKPAQAQTVAVPAVLNGRMGKPGDVDHWAITLKKGEAFDLDLRASRLGSSLTAVLTVLDASGKELARGDGTLSGTGDPEIGFTAPADGTYTLRIADRFKGRGGPDFAYRLYVNRPAGPGFDLQLASDSLTLDRGGQAKLRVNARRQGGFTGPITLAVEGLPKGVTVANATIAANQPATEVLFKADKEVAIRATRLTIRGSAKIGDKDWTRTAAMPGVPGAPTLDSVLLAVAMPTPFKVVGVYDMRWAARGTVHKRHYKLERGGFTGPIQVSVADRQMRHLQGVTGPTIIVPPGASEFDYSVQLPPWMETGRTCRVCVMAVGVVKDTDGSEHVVSFHSVQQNEQIVAVVEPGKLDITSERASLLATPGKAAEVPVRVARGKGLKGTVNVELIVPPHIKGISADAVTIAADKEQGALIIRFADKVQGPLSMPLLIRATLMDKGDPIIAEVKVDVQAPH